MTKITFNVRRTNEIHIFRPHHHHGVTCARTAHTRCSVFLCLLLNSICIVHLHCSFPWCSVIDAGVILIYHIVYVFPQWGVCPLADNHPKHSYFYQVTVSTGLGPESGTRSKVSLILSTDDADSGVRLLDDNKRKVTNKIEFLFL